MWRLAIAPAAMPDAASRTANRSASFGVITPPPEWSSSTSPLVAAARRAGPAAGSRSPTMSGESTALATVVEKRSCSKISGRTSAEVETVDVRAAPPRGSPACAARAPGSRSALMKQTATVCDAAAAEDRRPRAARRPRRAASRPRRRSRSARSPRSGRGGGCRAARRRRRRPTDRAFVPRRISITSRKPRVVTIAAGGRLRVISAFVATVVPCEKSDDVAQVDAGLDDARDDRVDRIRRRRHLADLDRPAVLVQDADVRERPAHVDCDAHLAHAQRLTRCRLRGMPKRGDTSLWHPFSDMAAVRGNELVISRGEGVWLWDEDGNRYLDGSASLWYCNVGHGRAEIADAVAAQMKQLEAWSIFGDTATPPALELADRLADLSSLEGAKIFLTTGGGDAIDTAAKLVRLYWQVLGQPERLHIISRTVRLPRHDGVRHVARRHRGQPGRLRAAGPEHVAGRVGLAGGARGRDRARRCRARRQRSSCEPVIGAGGVFPPPDGYVQAVAEICRDAGVLFVVRLGHLRLRPRRQLARLRALRRPARPGHVRQGRDQRLSPAGRRRRLRARGRAVLERARPGHRPPRPDLLRPRGGLRGGPRQPRHPGARGVGRPRPRARGRAARRRWRRSPTTRSSARFAAARAALVGVAFDPDALAADPALPGKAYKAIRPHGVILRALGSALAVSPPLTIRSDEIQLIHDAVRAGLDALVESRVQVA